MELKSLFVLASFAAFSLAQTTPTQVESDITNGIVPKLSAVITAIEDFSANGGSVDQAMTIHLADDDLNAAIVQVTDDLRRAVCPLSDSDATTILTDLEALSTNINSSLTDIVALKPELDTLGATPLIQQDLTVVKVSTDALGTALVACVSANIAPAAEQFIAGVDDALAPAISTFSS
ncbi:hypothetical protein E4T56_gene11315 [Termitomyces sp. T112]|nr:hypothetical protein E4T56_gene11315 [Termitomyces sp. T112]